MITKVALSRRAEKDLRSVPVQIARKLDTWIENVEHKGLEETRKIPGFHDEPLKGRRKGERSIRLSRSYRAIYTVEKDIVKFVFIKEVNKHAY